jgi:hypothetical protein
MIYIEKDTGGDLYQQVLEGSTFKIIKLHFGKEYNEERFNQHYDHTEETYHKPVTFEIKTDLNEVIEFSLDLGFRSQREYGYTEPRKIPLLNYFALIADNDKLIVSTYDPEKGDYIFGPLRDFIEELKKRTDYIHELVKKTFLKEMKLKEIKSASKNWNTNKEC